MTILDSKELRAKMQNNEELSWAMLDSLIDLMNEARLEKDATMFDSCARLVHEIWCSLIKENKDD
jgi:hypothetical protein